MAILVDKSSRIIVQGITGSEGQFHAEQCLNYANTQIVGGVTPGKGGQNSLGLPVFDTCAEAKVALNATVSLIFVPAAFAAEAIIEAADAGIELVVCITEGIPVRDMLGVMSYLKTTQTRLIGPNCPGLLTPDQAKVGIMPGFIAKPGRIGVVSKSGTLTYEAVSQIGKVGLGQSTCVGIGGDPLIGSSMRDIIQLFNDDDDTDAIVLIGEIGGGMEIEAAQYIKKHPVKPVIGFIAGETAPAGRRMGHAGAIVSGSDESANAKKRIMRDCGIHVVDSPALIGEAVSKVI